MRNCLLTHMQNWSYKARRKRVTSWTTWARPRSFEQAAPKGAEEPELLRADENLQIQTGWKTTAPARMNLLQRFVAQLPLHDLRNLRRWPAEPWVECAHEWHLDRTTCHRVQASVCRSYHSDRNRSISQHFRLDSDQLSGRFRIVLFLVAWSLESRNVHKCYIGFHSICLRVLWKINEIHHSLHR